MMQPQKSQPHRQLAELQQWLRWIIIEPRGVDAALAAPESEPQPRCLDSVIEAPPVARSARLDIYAEAYFARLAEALAKDFPAVDRVLRAAYGEDGFRVLCMDYLAACPSRSPNIADVGRELARFLKTHEFGAEIAFLPDLAALEWAVIESFYSERMAPLDIEALSGVAEEAWGGAVLSLDTSARLLETGWPVESVRDQSVSEDQACGEFAARTCRYLVLRQERAVSVHELSPPQWKVLQWIREGRALGWMCENADFDAASIMQWLQHWVAMGLVRDVKFPS